MPTSQPDLWTIHELVEHVNGALASSFAGVSNGRVRDVPDLRAIRYYTTLGLLDRPAEMRGRTAYYSRRHLWQLVAIKRLQAQGLSLAEVQQRLLGLKDRELERLADVKVEAPQHSRPEESQQRQDFWKASLAKVPAAASTATGPADATPCPQIVTRVPLGAGVCLELEAGRTIAAEDYQALRAAAEPLQRVLIERRLVRQNLERENHDEPTSDADRR